MKLILKQGERVEVELADTDGKFVISYGRSTLRVTSDLPDQKGREGVIYEERFGDASDIPEPEKVDTPADAQRTPKSGRGKANHLGLSLKEIKKRSTTH